ncbi:PREDICTED: ARMADILLO BTB ARABIDOPSIS PROTEIN 1-like [Tarenaya hassleriana]|uniref:ARMADILLO BTB ARABIDOPSIS PROTEIN 1-like n=1 Tax=Tarenaya hassleriana TaxID=28532 RepID=UPI00053C4352|nr:PREDICTED: ARMADILLO BTB ARABIDOPSIS PROTEIN 1-like [Tarenaya hassleriana]
MWYENETQTTLLYTEPSQTFMGQSLIFPSTANGRINLAPFQNQNDFRTAGSFSIKEKKEGKRTIGARNPYIFLHCRVTSPETIRRRREISPVNFFPPPMDCRPKRPQTTGFAGRNLRRKLDKDFGETVIDHNIGIRRQVEVLKTCFSDVESSRAAATVAARALCDLAENEENVDLIVRFGAVPALLGYLDLPRSLGHCENGQGLSDHVLEKECAAALGLIAIKPEYQQLIVDAGAIGHVVKLLNRPYVPCGCKAAKSLLRRAADLITHISHENPRIKTIVRTEGCIPPLVKLLNFLDVKVQRAAAGALRTLTFRNDENKNMVVELDALPSLVLMLQSNDPSVHGEAIGAIGNLVHSSPDIKKEVLRAGALQPVIGLLRSTCQETQREAALLLGQFAAPDSDCKAHIAQRGAIPPLLKLLQSPDEHLKEMSAFALGRLAQDTHNQAGIGQSGGIVSLLSLLDMKTGAVQHNAAFALYGLADNEDNVAEFIKAGGVQKLQDGELYAQPVKDCVTRTLKRLENKIQGRVLNQLLYQMRIADKTIQKRIALALAHLCEPEDGKLIFIDNKGLEALMELLDSRNPEHQKSSTEALYKLVTKAASSGPENAAPSSPVQRVFLGEKFVNDPTLSDITFLIDGRQFYAHKICLVASSDTFRALFDGFYKEKDAQNVEIPNIRWEVFELMMRFIYTGTVNITREVAPDLLRAADQYLLEGLKRLCEYTIAQDISVDNISLMYELADAYNASTLRRSCTLFVLEHFDKLMSTKPWFRKFVEDIIPEVRSYVTEVLTRSVHCDQTTV